MKKYSLFVALAFSLAACNSTGNNTENTDQSTATEAADHTVVADGIKDPVCGMSQDGEKFTEYVVSGTDTTWFCSSHCKEQFEKNPEKYSKAEAPKS